MKISAQLDTAEFKRLLKLLLDNLPSQRWMNKLGVAAYRTIRSRTFKGVDVEGNRFQEYSEGHARRREKLGLPTHPVNLTLNDITGMMTTLHHVVARDFSSVLIQLEGSRHRRIASYHNIQGAGKSKVIRRFMGLNDQEVQRIERQGRVEIAKQIHELSIRAKA